MKILVLSHSGYGAWFSKLFELENHSVDYYVDATYKNVLRGVAPLRSHNEVNARLAQSYYDLVVFDMSGDGREAGALHDAGINVIGSHPLADMLEDDRVFGLKAMEKCGIEVPKWEAFDDVGAARSFIKKTNKRYVFKPEGDDQDTAATYVSENAEDLLDYLDRVSEQAKGKSFVLQEVVQGTEVSTEAYWNGEDWFFVNGTLEEKKLMNDGLGPNTGCAGNVVWAHTSGAPVFERGLERLTPVLIEYGYRGMVDLNTIATSDGHLYGLEWTPRFGYDATATQLKLLGLESGYADFLYKIATGQRPVQWFLGGFAASVRLSIPPYPLETKSLSLYQAGVHLNGLDAAELLSDKKKWGSWYLYDAARVGDEFETCGASGFVCCPIAFGSSIEHAFANVGEMIRRIKLPNVQYRTDIARCCGKRYAELERTGWLRR